MVLRVEFGRSVMESGEILVPSEQALGLDASFEVAPQTQEGIEHLGRSYRASHLAIINMTM